MQPMRWVFYSRLAWGQWWGGGACAVISMLSKH